MTATLAEKRVRLRQILGQIDLGEQVRRRSVQQAISEAEAWFWCWRAEQFNWASRPDIALACAARPHLSSGKPVGHSLIRPQGRWPDD